MAHSLLVCGGGFVLNSAVQPKTSRHCAQGQGEYVGARAHAGPLVLALRTPTLRCGHLSDLSRTRGGFLDLGVSDHDGAYKRRVHVIVPFVGRKNGNLVDRQQSYNVLVLRVPGLEEGVMLGGKAL